MAKDVKKLAQEFAKRVGKPHAMRLLVIEGVSPQTADKILSGRYPSRVGTLIETVILRVIEQNNKAS